jgi:hypothetical protein
MVSQSDPVFGDLVPLLIGERGLGAGLDWCKRSNGDRSQIMWFANKGYGLP